MDDSRRQDDGPTWKKLASNIALVGSVGTAVIVVVGIIAVFVREQEKLRSLADIASTNTANIAIIEKRINRAEQVLDKREHTIANNDREIRELRARVRELERGK